MTRKTTCAIYGLRDKSKTDYFYIGSTKHSLEHRLSQHLAYTRLGYNKNRHFEHKLNQIGPENIVIELIETTSEEFRYEREHALIREYLDRGVKLTNIKLTPEWVPLSAAVTVKDAYPDAWQQYSNYEVQPTHIEAILDAYEYGVQKTGEPLSDGFAEIVERCAQHLITKRFYEFKIIVTDVVRRYRDTEKGLSRLDGFLPRLNDIALRGGMLKQLALGLHYHD